MFQLHSFQKYKEKVELIFGRSSTLTLENFIFGVFNFVEDFHVLNHIIWLAKHYIYKRILNIIHRSLKVFIAKVKATYQIAQKIAATSNKLVKRFQKMEQNFFPASVSLFCDSVRRDRLN